MERWACTTCPAFHEQHRIAVPGPPDALPRHVLPAVPAKRSADQPEPPFPPGPHAMVAVPCGGAKKGSDPYFAFWTHSRFSARERVRPAGRGAERVGGDGLSPSHGGP